MVPEAATAYDRSRRVRTGLLIAAAVVVGLVGRSVAADGANSPLLSWLPWNSRTPVTLFFGVEGGDYLVPVSRTVSNDDAQPEALVEALLAGPEVDSGLTNLVPPGTVATAVSFENGRLAVDLSGTFASESTPLGHEAVLQSMRLWPDVSEVAITVDGVPLETNTSGHLLYFYDEAKDRLVAHVTNRVRAGDVLEAYLEGPPAADLVGLPPSVQSVAVELGSNELLTLRFNFPDELRTFALDHPTSVRRVLEGLIATFSTGFPDVGGVLLDFDGHNALGLGQCANLLNTAQQMPDVLNDERLLSRYARST